MIWSPRLSTSGDQEVTISFGGGVGPTSGIFASTQAWELDRRRPKIPAGIRRPTPMIPLLTSVMSSTPVSVSNVPNAVTSARFALAIAVMGLIPYGYFGTALVVFCIAASTDWIDGYWARKYGQVTKLGRIFDPFVDKIIICGTFIALVSVPQSGVASWMATIVVGRELLVTSLRGMIEGSGGDFSASQLGKWKMVLQCAAVIVILLCLLYAPVPQWALVASQVLLWAAILLTIYSGYDYALAAARVMRSDPVEG